jgi:hypothetical protein
LVQDPEPRRIYTNERGQMVRDYGALDFPPPSWLAEWLDFYTPPVLLDRLHFQGFTVGRDGGLSLVNRAGKEYPLTVATLPGDPEHISAKLDALDTSYVSTCALHPTPRRLVTQSTPQRIEGPLPLPLHLPWPFTSCVSSTAWRPLWAA